MSQRLRIEGTIFVVDDDEAVRDSLALLLETVGHAVLFMDDDVQCRFVPVPGASHHVGFQAEALSTGFFESWDDVHRGPFTALDLVTAHEQVLNLDRRAVDPGNPDVLAIDTSRVSARFLKAIKQGGARVVVWHSVA